MECISLGFFVHGFLQTRILEWVAMPSFRGSSRHRVRTCTSYIYMYVYSLQFSSVQSLSHVQLFVALWTAARQASLSITNSRSPPKPISIESVMPSNHFILCRPLLLLPSIFPSLRVFSNESALRIRWPKYWSFSFNISPSNVYSLMSIYMYI